MQYDLIVFIGRLQPMHNAHLNIVKTALTQASRVLVLAGSSNKPRTIKNPFTFEERAIMLHRCLDAAERERVVIKPLRDFLYNEAQWLKVVQQAVADESLPKDARIGLIGHSKDASSYYLRMFPQWELIEVENLSGLNATELRDMMFCDTNRDGHWMRLETKVPTPVAAFLQSFALSPEYASLVQEYVFTRDYKAAWANAPYPPTFMTVDAVLTCSGHVLLVKRRAQPGKGLWALPGGFVGQTETTEQAMIRELREETRVKILSSVLRGSIKACRLFDHPDRSLRGRTLTHAFHIDFPSGQLPEVKGGDDAEKAKWFPIAELENLEPAMYEDHAEIISYFLGIA